jgi:23S rRNA (cytosine1962-C5)-methyltransferase
MGAAWLKAGREKSLLRRHPWIFSGAIARLEGEPGAGETIEVRDGQDNRLALGAYSPHSQIRIRVWTWNPQETVNADFFRRRLGAALAARRSILPGDEGGAGRLVHAESDGLPGLIVDRYADTLVMQVLSSGPERWRETLAGLLLELTGCRSVFERSDAEVRSLEGLPGRADTVRGPEPPEQIEIQENGLRYSVDIRRGHKSGFYLDQSENRARLQGVAAGRSVLDCFSYTGGFTLNALAGGATAVTAVEASADALDLARHNLALNNLSAERVEWVEGDVFQRLRLYRDQGRFFDLIVLDPPKFAPTAAQAQRAARGYKDINLLAFKLLRPGGLLFTFSCSGGISADLFQKIVAGAALDAGAEAQIQARMGQSPDHPVALNFPEGAYLKGLLCYKQ